MGAAQTICIHHSGQVYLGTWNNTQVAIKVLETEAGITPSSTVCSTFCFADDILMSCVQAIRQEIEVSYYDSLAEFECGIDIDQYRLGRC
jgi:hypothetical protein